MPSASSADDPCVARPVHSSAPAANVAAPPRRILQVIASIAAVDGGPSKAIAHFERELHARGYHVTTLTTSFDGPARRFEVDMAGSAEPTTGATRVIARLDGVPYKTSFSAVRWLGEHLPTFDVVHVHGLFSLLPVVSAWLARRHGVPYVIRPLGALNAYGMASRRRLLKRLSIRWMEGPLLRGAGAVQFTSTAEQDEASRVVPGEFAGRVIPLGVEPFPDAVGSPQAIARDAMTKPLMLLFMSRIHPKKNLEAVLHALSALQEVHPRLALVVCGEGEAGYVDELHALCQSLGVCQHVQWRGHVEGVDKTSILQAADIFVLPSHSENFGIAAAEAMAAGIPVLLGHGVALSADAARAGAGVACGTQAHEVTNALAGMLDQPEALAEMGEAGKKLVREKFSPAAMGAELDRLYRQLHADRERRR